MKTTITKTITTFCLLVSSIFVISASTTNSIQCTLKGEVIDRPQSSQLLLVKQGEDLRSANVVNIPINDGIFEYILNCDHEEQYELIFSEEHERGAWRPVPFFSENGIINFTLYPIDQFDKNMVTGGKLNRKYWEEYRNKVVSVSKAVENAYNEYVDDNYREILNEHGVLEKDFQEKLKVLNKNGIDISSALKEISGSTFQELSIWQFQYIKENPSIVGYSILLSTAGSLVQRNRHFQETNDISPYAELYQTVYAPKFPDHPYTEKMENLFAGASIKAGVPFVDFIAVGLDGEPVKLSERIAGKPTVLNLWASWCGPCRKKGKELIPVYEEFRDKGFVVIGVARERSISHAETAVQLDKYPWENLVELNDAEKIWEKYGIGNAGGMVFLIDEDGLIVATNPSIEEIKNFLLKNL